MMPSYINNAMVGRSIFNVYYFCYESNIFQLCVYIVEYHIENDMCVIYMLCMYTEFFVLIFSSNITSYIIFS